MPAMLQSVINNSKKITNKIMITIFVYTSSLLQTVGCKNYASMVRYTHRSYASLNLNEYYAADVVREIEEKLIALVTQRATSANMGRLIIDFTMIQKPFALSINGTTYDYDSGSKRVAKGFSVGCATWDNGHVTIPVTFALYFRKKDALETYCIARD